MVCGPMARVESKVLWTAEERQLDRIAQEPGERSLLSWLTSQRHTAVAAERAELHELSAAPSQPVCAGVTQDLPAVRALMRGGRPGMAWANQGAIGQYHRRRRARHIKAGDGN